MQFCWDFRKKYGVFFLLMKTGFSLRPSYWCGRRPGGRGPGVRLETPWYHLPSQDDMPYASLLVGWLWNCGYPRPQGLTFPALQPFLLPQDGDISTSLGQVWAGFFPCRNECPRSFPTQGTSVCCYYLEHVCWQDTLIHSWWSALLLLRDACVWNNSVSYLCWN